MFTQAYKAAFRVIRTKPLTVFGYAMLTGFISLVVTYFTANIALPSFESIFNGWFDLEDYLDQLSNSASLKSIYSLLAMCVGFLTTVGMARVYLVALEGKEPDSDHFLIGFSRIKKVIGGMLWQTLWTWVWSMLALAAFLFVFILFTLIGGVTATSLLAVDAWRAAGSASSILAIIGLILGIIVCIPVAVIAVIKGYSYRFVPHILATKPDVTAGQALKLSMELANGKKLHMWLADLIFSACVFVASLIVVGLCFIPFANIIFIIVAVVYFVVLAIFSPVFQGLYTAEFFRLKPMPKAPKAPRAPKVPNYNGGYGAPHGGYGAPQQGYGAPQQNYGAPQQNYGAPQQNYGAPQQNYGAPQQNYGAPQQNFNQNNQ